MVLYRIISGIIYVHLIVFYDLNNYKTTRQDLKQPHNLHKTIHEGEARG